MPYIESYAEFVKRMDCEQIQIEEGDRVVILFENGGRSNLKNHRNPPTGEWELLRAKRRYLEIVLEREQNNWNDFKQSCIHQAELAQRFRNVPGPPQNAPEQLEAGRKRINALKAKIRRIDAKLAESPRAVRRNEREAQQQAKAAEVGELKSRILAVK